MATLPAQPWRCGLRGEVACLGKAFFQRISAVIGGFGHLWRMVDADAWERTRNPWIMLQDIPRERLTALAGDALHGYPDAGTLPERLTLARQQKMPHHDLLLQVLSDEVARRESLAVTLRGGLRQGLREETTNGSVRPGTFGAWCTTKLNTVPLQIGRAHV